MSSMVSPDSKYANVGGIKIHYHDVGHGAPVLLLHGGGPGASGLSNFRKNLAPLSEKFRVIILDLPGYGESDNTIAPGSIFDALSDTVLGFLDVLNIEKIHLVGNSMGGATSLKLTVKNPDRVDRLVLMGPAGVMPVFAPMPTEGLIRMFGYYEGEGPTREKLKRTIDLLVYDPSMITPELLEERFLASTRPDVVANPPLRGRGGAPGDEIWRDRLSTLQHETLLIWGREDRVVPLDASLIPLKVMPNARLHVFPKCGHWAQWEKAEEFNRLVIEFLSAS